MSAVWLKLILCLVLCLSCTALSGPGSSGVVRKDLRGNVTIQCRSEPDQEYLSLKKGLNEEFQVLYKDGKSEKNNIAPEFTGRLQVYGKFPNLDIQIKDLTSDDTGAYWCIYKKFDPTTSQIINMKGTGSVLLLVTGGPRQTQQCEPSNNGLVLVSIVICAAVLLGIITCFLVWIILKTKMCSTKKPKHVAANDVYEDMRGTMRS